MNSSDLQDITITCNVCKFPFIWSAGEQQFFADRQFDRPRRCASCRRKRREQLEAREEQAW